MKYLKPSLVAPIPAVAFIFIASAAGFYFPSANSGELDDAPRRAAAVFMMLIPLVYVVGVIAICVLANGLGWLRQLTIRSMLLAAAITSIGFGVHAALSDPFGPHNALISLCMMTSFMAVIQIPTCYLWWYCHKKWESVQGDSRTRGS